MNTEKRKQHLRVALHNYYFTNKNHLETFITHAKRECYHKIFSASNCYQLLWRGIDNFTRKVSKEFSK